MNFWMTLWKLVFCVGVSVFAIMAVWVTVQGARDIFSLLTTLREGHSKHTE